MFVWAAGIALLCSLGAGWSLSGFFFQRKSYRALLSPALGLGLATSFFCLGDLFLQAPVNLAVTFALLIGAGFLGSKSGGTESIYPEPGKVVPFLLALLTITAWLFAVGSVQLFPRFEFLVWDLTSRTPGLRSPLMAAASLFGPDPWLGVLLLCGLAQLAVALGAFALARTIAPEGRTAWVLSGIFLLGVTKTGWLVFGAPEQCLMHLWGLGAFFLLRQESPNSKMLAAPLLGALFLVCWPLTLALVLGLARGRTALIAIGALGIGVHLYLMDFSPGLLVALGLYFSHLKKPVTESARAFCVLELVWGSSGLFGWTALAVEGGAHLRRLWRETGVGGWTLDRRGLGLPRKGFLTVVTVFSVWFGLDGAETAFNDVILIGGQQEKVSYPSLALPHSLSSWMHWRGPVFGVDEQDFQAIPELRVINDDFIYLTGELPDPRVAALMAVSVDRPLVGWYREQDGVAISKGCALRLFTGDSKALRGVQAPWVMVRGEKPEAVPEPASPGWEDEERVAIRIEGKMGRPISIDSVLVAELESGQPHEVPAASLVAFRFVLKNPTSFPLDLSLYRGVRFAPGFPHRQPLRPIDFPVAPVNLEVLEPGETVPVTAYLRTSIHPLDYSLGIRLTRADGSFQPVPLSSPFEVRSWRVELPLDYPFKDPES